jgi:hypothetical protein
MRSIYKSVVMGVLAIALHGTAFVSKAAAQCGYSPWNTTAALQPLSPGAATQPEPAALSRAADVRGSDGQIVGFWKFQFVSQGSSGIPDGAVVDNGFTQWHGDGTEITNSFRPPSTGNFCLGVWERTGESTYALNHFALGWDSLGNFIGPVQIKEKVTLSHNSDQFTGTFTIDQFNPTGNVLAHVQGQVTGTRITVDTPLGNWF